MDDVLLDIDKSYLTRLLNSLVRKGYLSLLKSSKAGSVYKIQSLSSNPESLKQALLPKISPFSPDLLPWTVGQIIYGTPLSINDERLSWLKPFTKNVQPSKSIKWQDLVLFSPKWAKNEPFVLDNKIIQVLANDLSFELPKIPLKEEKKPEPKQEKLVKDEDIGKQEGVCGLCNKKFPSLKELMRHIKKEHRDE
ncbi:MAG: C2H2-type zinc finger protein [Nitrososphaerales archaeon]